MIARVLFPFVVITIGSFLIYFFIKGEPSLGILPDHTGYQKVESLGQVFTVYPRTIKEINARTHESIKSLKKSIESLILLSPENLNKDNLLYAFDKIAAYFTTHISLCHLVQLTHPDEKMRAAAVEVTTQCEALWIDLVSSNESLYKMFKHYADDSKNISELSDTEKLYLQDIINDFERDGLHLSEDIRLEFKKIAKELVDLCNQFSLNIAQDSTQLYFSEEELSGVSAEFKHGLSKNSEGLYKVVLDYPTTEMILNRCEVESTRKKYFQAKDNKAYPINQPILEKIIALRDGMAQLTGFESYAAYEMHGLMAKDPERVQTLLDDLLPKVIKKSAEEFKLLAADLPSSVVLTKDKKIKPWDMSFLYNYHKKKYYQVDELALAEYFPLEQTIEGLFNIYSKFFNISFEHLKDVNAWHEDVSLVVIKSPQEEVLGYVFLDLFPRSNKFQHAAKFSGINARIDKDGNRYPAVCSLVCNFTKPSSATPSLLKYQEVSTFFHEFGHALHSILGATQLSLQSGTHVKHDFVEMPSQILEHWLEDREILKLISSHYITGEPLSDELIESKLHQIKFGRALFYDRQIWLTQLALAFFAQGSKKDLQQLEKEYLMMTSPYLEYDDTTHFYCSWGHLTGYGSKYYGYLWSRIIACDVFDTINSKKGLLKGSIGKHYAALMLAPGGSQDPEKMVKNFLQRDWSQDPFLRYIGLL